MQHGNRLSPNINSRIKLAVNAECDDKPSSIKDNKHHYRTKAKTETCVRHDQFTLSPTIQFNLRVYFYNVAIAGGQGVSLYTGCFYSHDSVVSHSASTKVWGHSCVDQYFIIVTSFPFKTVLFPILLVKLYFHFYCHFDWFSFSMSINYCWVWNCVYF